MLTDHRGRSLLNLSICSSLLVIVAYLVIIPAAQGQRGPVRISVGNPAEVGTPVITAEGKILVGVASSRPMVASADLEAETANARTILETARNVQDVQLATTRTAEGSIQTYAVVRHCPQPLREPRQGRERARLCSSDSLVTAVELTPEGNPTGRQVSLPGSEPGRLFASNNAFVWAYPILNEETGRYEARRAILDDGSVSLIQTSEPTDLDTIDQCVTANEIWSLQGRDGPRNPDARTDTGGRSNVEGFNDRQYALFRYPLDGTTNNPWQEVPMSGLAGARLASLACGEEQGYVLIAETVYPTSSPTVPVSGLEEAVYYLAENRSRRPVAFLRNENAAGEALQCALIAPDQRLVYSADRPATADQNRYLPAAAHHGPTAKVTSNRSYRTKVQETLR